MQRGKLIYVASPYSHPDKTVQEWRFLCANIATGYLMNNFQELSFYSPIAHTHPIATYCKLPGDWQFWRQFDETVLSRCDEIWVLLLDGWEVSKGVQGEIEIAHTLNLPIKRIKPNGDGTYEVSEFLEAVPQ